MVHQSKTSNCRSPKKIWMCLMEVLVAALKRTLHYQTQLNNSLAITLQLRIKVECLLISITLQAKFKILVPSNLAQL